MVYKTNLAKKPIMSRFAKSFLSAFIASVNCLWYRLYFSFSIITSRR